MARRWLCLRPPDLCVLFSRSISRAPWARWVLTLPKVLQAFLPHSGCFEAHFLVRLGDRQMYPVALLAQAVQRQPLPVPTLSPRAKLLNTFVLERSPGNSYLPSFLLNANYSWAQMPERGALRAFLGQPLTSRRESRGI